MGKKFDHVVSEMDDYIRVMMENRKAPPTKIHLRYGDYRILENASEEWGNQVWENNGILEYRGIPIEPLGEE